MKTDLTHDYEIPTWAPDEAVMAIDCKHMLRATTADINHAIELYCSATHVTKYPNISADMMDVLQGFALSCKTGRILFGTEEQNGNRWLEILMHRIEEGMIDQILMSEDGEEYTFYELEKECV